VCLLLLSVEENGLEAKVPSRIADEERKIEYKDEVVETEQLPLPDQQAGICGFIVTVLSLYSHSMSHYFHSSVTVLPLCCCHIVTQFSLSCFCIFTLLSLFCFYIINIK